MLSYEFSTWVLEAGDVWVEIEEGFAEGENIARFAGFMIKSNDGDGLQTRARIVTSNRIILRHGDPYAIPLLYTY